MAMLHEGTERMVNMTLDQAAWLPEEGKKAIEEWIEACENGREEFKKLVDENFKRFDRFFLGQRKAKKAASK
jgi:polyhydroxyalkanoate synthesis regulator phasin